MASSRVRVCSQRDGILDAKVAHARTSKSLEQRAAVHEHEIERAFFLQQQIAKDYFATDNPSTL